MALGRIELNLVVEAVECVIGTEIELVALAVALNFNPMARPPFLSYTQPLNKRCSMCTASTSSNTLHVGTLSPVADWSFTISDGVLAADAGKPDDRRRVVKGVETTVRRQSEHPGCTSGPYPAIQARPEDGIEGLVRQAVKDAGGVGMVLVNASPNSLNSDFHAVPTVHLAHTDRAAVQAALASPVAISLSRRSARRRSYK